MKSAENGAGFLKKSLRFILQFSIIGYLLYQLYVIGLVQVLKSLPTNPVFYLLYGAIYFSLPLAEILIYRIKWPVTIRNSFTVFLQKKVLNSDVLGYSGELYLYQWVKNSLGKPAREAANFIKDNNILSSVASTLITLVLLLFFITRGYININTYLEGISYANWLLIALAIGVAGAVIYRFRKSILTTNRADTARIFSLHASRIILINALQILQWKVARPDIALPVWFTFSAVQIIASRIPFLPSTDVLFVNVALEMSTSVTMPKEAIAGILAANLILSRILNVISYLVAEYYRKRNPVVLAPQPEPEIS